MSHKPRDITATVIFDNGKQGVFKYRRHRKGYELLSVTFPRGAGYWSTIDFQMTTAVPFCCKNYKRLERFCVQIIWGNISIWYPWLEKPFKCKVMKEGVLPVEYGGCLLSREVVEL